MAERQSFCTHGFAEHGANGAGDCAVAQHRSEQRGGDQRIYRRWLCAKITGAISCIIPAILSKKVGAPVMMRISREEEHFIGVRGPACMGE